ncbi:nuclease [Domibacillus antri]|uniref:Nuclease n=1 Tax=Domibacillus antri TaxID=1714264 RepID=A0A1Q8Q3N6_9BACI|nr:DUF2800 domain-containing protein [Domibacillus antri]OLN21881.1 nuclease [Domibacillus antri]
MAGHAERDHAVLSASGAHRWLKCTKSASKEKGIADTTSEFAKEGTFAHELSELHFAHLFQGMTKRTFNSRLKKMKQNEFYTEELHEYVREYVDLVEERVHAARARGEAVLMFEERLDLSDYVPESFGTGDVIIMSGGVLEIIDLKYGKGIEVNAENNAQLRLYALGALSLFDLLEDVEEVVMTIIQPRLDNISTEQLPADELKAWGLDYVKPRAEMAWNGEGEFVPGDHCRFCKVKHTCRARAEANLNVPQKLVDPDLLTPEEISDILFQADELQKWAKDVQDYALEKARSGTVFEGWKVVEGRSSRKYTDEEKVMQKLEEEFDVDQFTEVKLLTISNLEKRLGKKTVSDLLGELIVKPPGKPALVPESDKRPAIGSAEAAANEFDVIQN